MATQVSSGIDTMQIDEELTLKKLEIFLAFMRSGNLSRAAAELDTSTVSVHRALHSLENALRCPLFKREGRKLSPLESAHVLEDRAQKLIADMLDTVRLTREAAGFSAERFKLGALYSLTVKTVPQLIMGLKLRRSELNIDLILGSNIDLLYKLKNLELDAILVSLNDSVADPDCDWLPLFRDDIFLAVPVDSPFASQAEIDLAELREATFITLTQGFATHQDALRVFQQAVLHQLADAQALRAGEGEVELAGNAALEQVEVLGAADAGHDHVQIVQPAGIDLGQRAGQEVRLLLVVAFQHHAIAGGDQRFQGGDYPVARQDHAIGEATHLLEPALLLAAPARPLRRGGNCCCHACSTGSAIEASR
ncbi:hypothetical protein GCM10027514_32370 [Azotobacter armeniacus]